MRVLSLLAAAFVLAAGAFWVTMLTAPPKSEAALSAGINTQELTIKAHPNEGRPYDAF
jgi:hypothetical protein